MTNNVTERINSIQSLISHMKQLPQDVPPVKHHFSEGVYAREMFMPAGLLIVGKIHKTRHLNIVSQGKCVIVTSARRIEIEAPFTFESFEGEQKVVYMLSDVVWTTIHLTQSTDLAVIEEETIADEYDEQLVEKLINSFGGLSWSGQQQQ